MWAAHFDLVKETPCSCLMRLRNIRNPLRRDAFTSESGLYWSQVVRRVTTDRAMAVTCSWMTLPEYLKFLGSSSNFNDEVNLYKYYRPLGKPTPAIIMAILKILRRRVP